jgi:hypothetical protein
MNIIKIFIISLAIFSEVLSYDDSEGYCKQNGGQVIEMTAQFDTYVGYVNGNKRKFCRVLNSDGNLGYIGLDTFGANLPSLGATYSKSIVLDPSKIISGPFPVNNLNLCYALGGSNLSYYLIDSGFSDEYGQADICIFGDGSSVAAWTLLYMGIGYRLDIKNNIVANSLSIPLPNIPYV